MAYLLLFLGELFILFLFSRWISSALATIFMRFTRSQTITIHLLSFLFLPGVIIHELAHMLIASLLFVRVGEIKFFPQVKESGVKLGSVAVAKTDPFRRALIGIAPVLVGMGIIIIVLLFFTSDVLVINPILKYILLFYVLFEVSNTMFSSRKDMEGTIALLGAGSILGLALFFAGVRVPFDWIIDWFSQESTIALMKQAVFFLLIPIAVDVFIYLVTRIFSTQSRLF